MSSYSANNNSSLFSLDHFKENTQIVTKEDVSLKIMTWGYDNYFPQTFKNIVEQSPNAKPAVSRTATFYKGGSFEGEDIIINTYGLTLRDVVDKSADDLALFDAFAISSNFNMDGTPTDMIPMRLETLRFNQFDELNYASKIGYHRNFGDNDVVQKNIETSVKNSDIKFINIWNPKYALDQIEQLENGVQDYNGQILYYSGAGPSTYPIPQLQSAINYVLSDVENSILVRKETSTGFISSYLLKSTLNYDDPNLVALENAISAMQGARGMGKLMTMSGLGDDEIKGNLLEEIGGGNNSAIIESATKTFELDRQVITGAYLIPPILSGADVNTGFSTESLKDAYNVFNAITEPGRERIQKEINKILSAGDFGIDSIELTPLSLSFEEEAVENTESEDGVNAENQTLTNLSGRQMQGIQRIVRKYNKGELTEAQATDLLKGGFGFDDEAVANWLVTPEEEAEEAAQEGEPKIKIEE
tara:strand:+ start:4523 stop:5944 length:1422 start_codon:yes stop_codon:yes gene_type:complete